VSGRIRPAVDALKAYDASRPQARVRLDSHENPWDLPAGIKRKALARLRSLEFNRYPDPSAARLKELLASYAGEGDGDVAPSQIVLGNGSDELIQYLLLTLDGEGAVVPTPSFSMYAVTGAVCGARPILVPLSGNYELPAGDVIAASKGARVVFIAYPNNPTGNCFDRAAVERVLDEAACTVVVDEAYFEFSGKTFVHEVASRQNLVVLRTLSKGFGLAGIRLGYAVAPPPIAEALEKVRLPYNIGALGQAVAECALAEPEGFLRRAGKLRRERKRLARALSKLQGVTPFPSDANFILFRTAAPAGDLHAALLRRGVLVKNLDGPGTEGCLRVTVGTRQENDAFLEALGGAEGGARGALEEVLA